MIEGKRVRLSKEQMLDFTAQILNNTKGNTVRIIISGHDTEFVFDDSDAIVATAPMNTRLSIRHKTSLTAVNLENIAEIVLESGIQLGGYVLNTRLILKEQDGVWEYFTPDKDPVLWLQEEAVSTKTDNIVDLAEYKARKYKK